MTNDISSNKEFPVLAICYDFDKTLSPIDMQAQGFIQSIGYDPGDFWRESDELAQDNEMDKILAYMYEMISQSKKPFTLEYLKSLGLHLDLFPGVEEWFERVNAYGKKHHITIEHYIISSGSKEMIEGTSIAHFFQKVYASSFYFDKKGNAKWPAQVVNFTSKTQFLFRIEKGKLDINDEEVNTFFEPKDLKVPYRNMVYIGDSDTDIPCMKLVNSHGGHSIGVYNPQTCDKTKVYQMMEDKRIGYFAEADYSKGKALDRLIQAIIDKTERYEKLEKIHIAHLVESKEATQDKLIHEAMDRLQKQ